MGNNIQSSSNIFQYPETGVESLIPGKKYFWQILRSFNTTNGISESLSPIFIFKMQDTNLTQTFQTSSLENVMLENLKLLIGYSKFNQLFDESGELYNFNNLANTITVDNEQFSINYILDLIEMLNNNQINILDIDVE